MIEVKSLKFKAQSIDVGSLRTDDGPNGPGFPPLVPAIASLVPA